MREDSSGATAEGKDKTVRLKEETHKRLAEYLLTLMNERHDPFLKMDDAISSLLDLKDKSKPKK